VLLGISKNISELCASEEKFAKAFHGNPSPMAISSLSDDTLIDVNEAFLKTLGYARNEVIGRRSADLGLFADPGMRSAALSLFLENGSLRGFEIAARTKDGKIRNGLFAADYIELQDQKLLLTVMTDITERKQTEAILQEAKAQQRAILDNLPFLAWLKDAQGRSLKVNEPFSKACGFTQEELQGKTDFDIWPQELADGYVADDRLVMETGKKKRTEEKIAGKTGTNWVETFKTPIYDNQGNLLGTTGFASDITERKENEEARRVIQARLERVVEGSNDGFWDWHVPSGRVIYNDRWQEMLGYQDGEIEPTPEGWFRLLHPNDKEKVMAAVHDYWAGRSPKFEQEFLMLTKSGGWCWILCRGKVVDWVAPGQPEWMTGTHVNIHERKMSVFLLAARNQVLERIPTATSIEELLQPFTNHVRNIWPESPLSIMILDKSGKRLFNANAVDLPDFYCRAVNGMSIGPQAGSCGTAAYSGKRMVVEDILTHPNWVPFHDLVVQTDLRSCWSEPMLSLSGQVLGCLAIYSKVPMSPDEDDLRMLAEVAHIGAQAIERYRMSRELRESEARFRTLCDNVPGWIIWQLLQTPENDFRLVYLSGNTNNILSVPANRVLEDFNLVKSAFSPDDYASFTQTMIDGRGSGQSLDRLLLMHNMNGREKWLHLRAAPHNQSNGYTLWDGIAIDMSEMKRTEEELERAKKEAENANQAKSLFLANMSHEIRTPMNAVLGFVQLLQRDPEATPRQQQQFAAIGRSSEHLLGLITGILEMSKIEAGKTILNPIQFDLQALLEDLNVMFQIQAAAKSLCFSTKLAPNIPRQVEADGVKLRQIFINLIGNAVKFTAKGGVFLRAEMAPAEDGFMRLLAEIEDSGSGIAPEELPRLFHAFSQTDSGMVSGGGTGLGLIISRQFAQMMGGDITVESQVGKGSNFRLSVLVRPFLSPEKSLAGETSRRILRLRSGQPAKRILVVDDKIGNREVLELLLKSVGFHVGQAADGNQAIARFIAEKPDLIFMDMRMPEMDGLEAIRRIRGLAGGDTVKIIVLSASAFETDRQEAMEAGADAFIVKPFRDSEVFSCIGEMLEIDYLYADIGNTIPAALDNAARLPLPAALIVQLREAVLDGDIGRLLADIDQVEKLAPDAAAGLRQLASRFDYDRLLIWLDNAPETSPDASLKGN
jgi:PAS domain S-box-containing protein